MRGGEHRIRSQWLWEAGRRSADHRGEHTRDGSARGTEVKAGLARRPGEAEAEQRKLGTWVGNSKEGVAADHKRYKEEQEARPTGG